MEKKYEEMFYSNEAIFQTVEDIIMDNLYESLVQGLEEAIEDARSKEKKLKRNTVVVIPVKTYTPAEIKGIRSRIGFSQNLFASYMGVSVKTVEAWEKGTNAPSGAASRILSMMEMDPDLTSNFPFVTRTV